MQLRKFFSFAICLILIFSLAGANVLAASEYDSDASIAAGVIATAGTSATYETDLSGVPIIGRLFATDPDDFGQDLYETIYDRVKHQGSDIAVSRTLARRPLSKEELRLLIPGANIGELLKQESPEENLPPERITERLAEFNRLLVEEKELADLLVQTKLEVEPTELFSNGDESDSGFDLIADLKIIDQILFGETETVLGGGPGSAGGAAEGRVIGPRLGEGEEGAEAAARGEAAGRDRTELSRTGADSRAGTSAAPLGSSIEEQGILCPLSGDFNSAVVAARAESRARGEDEDSGRGDSSGRRGDTGHGSESAGAGEGRETEGAESGEPEEPPSAEEPADWSRLQLCGERFCLTLERVYKTESAYLPNENCIACHFEKINDAFKKTLGHNLVPNKATGNLIEVPKCKMGILGGLKFNLIVVPQPIVTPPNDDLIVKGDFIKNAEDFWEKYDPTKTKRCTTGGAGDACKTNPDSESEVAQRILQQVPEDTPQDKILRDIETQVVAKKEEAAKFMKEHRTNKDAQNQASQFEVLMQEIEAFNRYFESFVALYNTLVSSQPDKPCKLLLSKPTCSSL